MANLVIDASLAAAWCFPDEQTDYVNAVLRAVSSSHDAFVPRIWAYEIRNSILMGVRRGRINQGDAETFLHSIGELRIHLTDPVSYDDIFKLAARTGLTYYDAAYLNLAQQEGSQLASLDNALRNAAVKVDVALFNPRSPA